jgi:hypothetical protein
VHRFAADAGGTVILSSASQRLRDSSPHYLIRELTHLIELINSRAHTGAICCCFCVVSQAGGNIHLLHIVFAGYICTSTIILLNMLIAMMNSTYSAISSKRTTSWRIESLRTALWVERKLPFMKRSMFVRFDTTLNHDFNEARWYIKFTTEQVG